MIIEELVCLIWGETIPFRSQVSFDDLLKSKTRSGNKYTMSEIVSALGKAIDASVVKIDDKDFYKTIYLTREPPRHFINYNFLAEKLETLAKLWRNGAHCNEIVAEIGPIVDSLKPYNPYTNNDPL